MKKVNKFSFPIDANKVDLANELSIMETGINGAVGLAGTFDNFTSNEQTKVPTLNGLNISQLASLDNTIDYGDENIWASGLSTVGAGASLGGAVGSIFGPIGTVVGGAIGGLGGFATGLLNADKRNNQKDLAEREYTKEFNSNINAQQQNIMQQKNASNYNLAAYGGEFTNGLTIFDTGGQHEQNPYGGILQGIGSNGKPNMVEEGEVKWDDYIFSNRLKVNTDSDANFYLPKKVVNSTFATAAKKLSKAATEEFDPITKRTQDVMLGRLKDAQDTQKNVTEYEEDFNTIASDMGLNDQIYAAGGKIHIKESKKGTFTAAAKKHGKSVQEFAQQVLGNKNSYSSAMVKKANFARNAASWHDLGGNLYSVGGEIRNTNNRVNISPIGINRFDNGDYLQSIRYESQFGFPIVASPTKMNDSTPKYNSGFFPNIATYSSNIIDIPSPMKGEIVSTTVKEPDKYRSPITTKKGATPKYNSKEKIAPLESITTTFTPGPFNTITPSKALIMGTQPSINSKENDAPVNYNQLLEYAPTLSNLGLTLEAMAERPANIKYPRLNLSGYKQDEDFIPRLINPEFIASKLRQNAAAQRRSIMESSGGSHGAALAGIMPTNATTTQALGDAYMNADDTNYQRILNAKQLNNAARATNAQLALEQFKQNMTLDQAEQMYNLQSQAARRNAIRNGLNALSSNLADIARYQTDRQATVKATGYTREGNKSRD